METKAPLLKTHFISLEKQIIFETNKNHLDPFISPICLIILLPFYLEQNVTSSSKRNFRKLFKYFLIKSLTYLTVPYHTTIQL